MLSLAEIKAYGPQYKTVPVSRCMYADIRTPVEVMRILKTVSSQCYLLESMEDSKRWGRYTFLGYDPQMELACKDGTVHIRAGTDIEVQTEDPASFLRQVLADNAAPRIDGLPPFTGGLMAALIMGEAGNAAGMPALGTLSSICFIMQGFVGFPLTALFLKKEATRVLGEIDKGSWVVEEKKEESEDAE